MTQNSCLTHTFWIGVLIAILILFGFHGCHSVDILPCVIRANPEENVAVRVGPGTERAIRFYMADDENFVVIGVAGADDDTDWWQIEMDDVSQAWVAQDDVVTVGNCAAVGDADIPPIIERSDQEAPPPPAASSTPTVEGDSPPSDPDGTLAPPPTQGLITNTPPDTTAPPSDTPVPTDTLFPTSTGTPG